jgi:hypothetical protein
MNEKELKKYENDLRLRFRNNFDMSEEAISFVINMVASFHSTRGGACMNMHDYFDMRNLD